MVKTSMTLLLLGLSLSSSADCQIRTNIRVSNLITDSQPTDARYLVTPDSVTGYQCTVQYRIHYEGTWHDVEGSAHGDTKADACAHSLDINRGYILTQERPKRVVTETQMVCNDRPEIHVHPVAVGDEIWESETEFPRKRKFLYFKYQENLCRFFEEKGTKNRIVQNYTGVICRDSNSPDSKWRVVDKF